MYTGLTTAHAPPLICFCRYQFCWCSFSPNPGKELKKAQDTDAEIRGELEAGTDQEGLIKPLLASVCIRSSLKSHAPTAAAINGSKKPLLFVK